MPSWMGGPVWLRAVEPFVNRDDVGQMIMAIAAEDRELFERRYRASVAFMNIRVIEGGAERSDTVARALEVVDPRCEYVAIHDAARPCLATGWSTPSSPPLASTAPPCRRSPSPRRSSESASDRFTTETVPRERLYLAQTPQVFRRDLLFKAYAQRSRAGGPHHRRLPARRGIGHRCAVVEGSPFNIKITTHEDLKLAAAILPLLEKPRRDGPSHPYSDEQAIFEQSAQAQGVGPVPVLSPGWRVCGPNTVSPPAGRIHPGWPEWPSPRAARRASTRGSAPWRRPRCR